MEVDGGMRAAPRFGKLQKLRRVRNVVEAEQLAYDNVGTNTFSFCLRKERVTEVGNHAPPARTKVDAHNIIIVIVTSHLPHSFHPGGAYGLLST